MDAPDNNRTIDHVVDANKQKYTRRVRNPKVRNANVFDAVAGRVNYQGFLPGIVEADLPDAFLMATAVPPEEVLFRYAHAPRRNAENDFYWADRFLPNEKLLPNSDLLKALHTFASAYYSRTSRGGGKDFETMNDTALLALGILVEESVAESLGEEGHMAFYESQPLEEDNERSRGNTPSRSRASSVASESATRPVQKTKSNKRRKLTHSSSATEKLVGDLDTDQLAP